jgi:hypothetical protein
MRFPLLALVAVAGFVAWTIPAQAQEPPTQPTQGAIQGPTELPSLAPSTDVAAPSSCFGSGCSSGGCGGGCGCATGDDATCLGHSVWFRAQYLQWWVKSAPMPILLTTDPTNGATPTAGGLGDPTTRVVLGNSRAEFDSAPGIRGELGIAICEDVALEGGGFVLSTERRTLGAASNAAGSPFLFRPFVNIDNNNPNAGAMVSIPGLVAGSFTASSQTQLWGVDPHVYSCAYNSGGCRLGWVTGFRYLDLQEELDMRQSSTMLAAGGTFQGKTLLPGDRIGILDQFRTHNAFYGGQIGARGEMQMGCWVLSADFRLGLGATEELVADLGSTTLYRAAPGQSFIAPGGLFAPPSNNAHQNATDFAVVPEVALSAGYQVSKCVELSFGYDFLYIGRVVRPGDQVPVLMSASQIAISPTFVPGSTATVPQPMANRTDFWAQGVHAELTIRY